MTTKWKWLAVFGLLAVGCSTEPLDLAEFPPDGVLDCSDDNSWGIQAGLDPDAFGFATLDEALAAALSPYLQMNDELRETQNGLPTRGSLLNDENREVVIAGVTELAPDNWQIVSFTGCNGYELS